MGGTTSNILARELELDIKTDKRISIGKLPAPAQMKDIDLVTEGILTLTMALEYLENGTESDDAAGQICALMINSDLIEFLVGARINEAHYDPDLPIEIGLRKNVVNRIGKVLESKYSKEVKMKFI